MLKRISSKTTFIMKRVFPIFWFGFLAFFLLVNFASGMWAKAPVFLAIPLLMAGFGFVLMKKLVWDLMDEVYDCGDHLVIRNRGEEVTVRLADVINVSSTMMVNPPRITLRLAASSNSAATCPSRRRGRCSTIRSAPVPSQKI